MKTWIHATLLLCILPLTVQAQDTTASRVKQLPVIQNTLITVHSLSDSLTLLASGRLDPFTVLPAIAHSSARIVSVVDSLLSTGNPSPRGQQGSISTIGNPVAFRYALKTLEILGTPDAYSVIMKYLSNTTSLELKGEALSALSNAFLSGGFGGTTTPDKEIVHALVSNLDDTSFVSSLQKSIGEIAREGICNWLGVDFGIPQGKNRHVMVGNPKQDLTVSAVHEAWWAGISARIVWSSNLHHFEIK